MTIYLLLLLILVLSSCRFRPGFAADEDCLTPRRSRCWKGIFVLLILMSHFMGYITPDEGDELYLTLRTNMGQTVVSLFFFYTGFGMTTRLMEKGIAYLRTVPRRFLRIWLITAVSVAAMFAVQIARGRSYDGETVLMAFLCWANIGNSTWYIFVTLAGYALFAVSALFLLLPLKRASRLLMPAVLTALTVLFIGWMQRMELEEYWYDTVILLPVGAWWAVLRGRCRKYLIENAFGWGIVMTVLLTAFAAFYPAHLYDFTAHEGWIAAFTLLIAVLSSRVVPEHPLLGWCGDHALSIYLFQRIPMIIAYETGLADAVPHMSFLPVAAAALLLAGGVDLAIRRLSGRRAAA